MRLPLIAIALGLAMTSSAWATTPADAQSAFVERRGLLEVDARCRLLAPGVRTALQAGAQQARGALLRGGWTRARVDELERAATGAARNRACADPRNETAAVHARAGYASWARTNAMTFPGAERTWAARRYPDAFGWRLLQDIGAPIGTAFGVRERDGAQRLTLTLPLTRTQQAPGSAQLILRDPARAGVDMLELRGRLTQGLAAGAPAPSASRAFFASARRVETLENGQRVAVLEFPDTAFEALLALDPRETAELRLDSGRAVQRILVEIGDVAVARAFLTLRPES
jgi:hypothetical protein